jgi:3-vinyl bacteriochlorophyllide hydratase
MALYTPEERIRRDASPWTLVQGVLAPIQFLVFLVSAALVLRYLISGVGFEAATTSIVIKTLVLYAIMITGSIWERAVFGRYLFAPAFYWEDFVSMFVLALHTAYLGALLFHAFPRYQMYVALIAYAAYLLNATQFLIKLRAARLEQSSGQISGQISGQSSGQISGQSSGQSSGQGSPATLPGVVGGAAA